MRLSPRTSEAQAWSVAQSRDSKASFRLRHQDFGHLINTRLRKKCPAQPTKHNGESIFNYKVAGKKGTYSPTGCHCIVNLSKLPYIRRSFKADALFDVFLCCGAHSKCKYAYRNLHSYLIVFEMEF